MLKKKVITFSLLLLSLNTVTFNNIQASFSNISDLDREIETTGCLKNPITENPLPQQPLITRYAHSTEAYLDANGEIIQEASKINTLRSLVGDEPTKNLYLSLVKSHNSLQEVFKALNFKSPKSHHEDLKKDLEEERRKTEEAKQRCLALEAQLKSNQDELSEKEKGIAAIIASLNSSLWEEANSLTEQQKKEESEKLLTQFLPYLRTHHSNLLSSTPTTVGATPPAVATSS